MVGQLVDLDLPGNSLYIVLMKVLKHKRKEKLTFDLETVLVPLNILILACMFISLHA